MHHNTQGGAAEQPSVFMSQNIEAYPLEFTGSGGEYFRVWIVNVLLGIVTLGFYTPWARRRTAMYFYGHSLVAHSPLEFTAQQRKMVLGFVLLALISIAYQIVAKTGQDLAVGLMLLSGAVLAPYLWASAMRFRLGATRWKGLRLQFSATWKEVYLASWPVFALALVWFGVFFGMQMLSPELAQALDGPAASGGAKVKPQFTAPMGALLGLGLALGDVSGVVSSGATLLTSRAYSRSHEREADCYAIALMRQASLPTAPMGQLLLAIAHDEEDEARKPKGTKPAESTAPAAEPASAPKAKDKAKDKASTPRESSPVWSLLASHPDTVQRATELQQGHAPHCAR